MKTLTVILVACVTVLISLPVLYGQDNDPLQAAIDFSDSLAGKDMNLYNARIYTPELSRAKGHPFLGTDQWQTGMVIYNRQAYEPVELLYDLFRDQLVLFDRSQDGSVNHLILNPEMTDRFMLEDREFINLGYSGRMDEEPDRNYYELIFVGKASLVARWTKTFDDIRSQDTPFGEYRQEKRNLFIWIDRDLLRVTTRISILRALDDHRDAIRAYLNENNINVTMAADEEIIGVLKKYNELPE